MANFAQLNYYVTVKCKTCGIEIGFFPHHVGCLQSCICGNNDYGNPDNWDKKDYGGFEWVTDEIWELQRWYRSLYNAKPELPNREPENEISQAMKKRHETWLKNNPGWQL